MADSMRQYANGLGLRYTNKKGRLLFERNTPVHGFWNDVLKLTVSRCDSSARESFERVVEVVDRYGPEIWMEGEQDHLFFPGERLEYTKALCWPSDREA
jgi:hypothetical protein